MDYDYDYDSKIASFALRLTGIMDLLMIWITFQKISSFFCSPLCRNEDTPFEKFKMVIRKLLLLSAMTTTT
jgi:hypothetical protein